MKNCLILGKNISDNTYFLHDLTCQVGAIMSQITTNQHRYWCNYTKVFDFVPFYVWMVQEKSSFEFVFKIFEGPKIFLHSLDIKRSKNIISIPKTFLKKTILFLFKLALQMFLASLWGTSLIHLKVSTFDKFCLKIFIFFPPSFVAVNIAKK